MKRKIAQVIISAHERRPVVFGGIYIRRVPTTPYQVVSENVYVLTERNYQRAVAMQSKLMEFAPPNFNK